MDNLNGTFRNLRNSENQFRIFYFLPNLTIFHLGGGSRLGLATFNKKTLHKLRNIGLEEMIIRKDPLVNDQIYHVLNKSIEGFKIFNHANDFSRMIELISYYRYSNVPVKYSQFVSLHQGVQDEIRQEFVEDNQLVIIVAFCLMPTHIHLILKQVKEKGITTFTGNILNSYAKYFNIKHKRKGPLWEGRFKSVLVKSDRQLLHLTRYLHLNPVSAGLINDPEDWVPSSYKEYISIKPNYEICKFDDILDIKSGHYKKFVKNRISYQREITRIKKLLLEQL